MKARKSGGLADFRRSCGHARRLPLWWIGGLGFKLSALAVASPALSARRWFTPNQLAANAWYRPEGSVINGHLSGSFSNFSLWPSLRAGLASASGGFGVYAAELAFLSAAQLGALRAAGLPVQAEDPTWTQCLSAQTIGDLALRGASPAGEDLFCSIFQLCAPGSQRPNATGLGWYLTSEGASFAPDALVLDERMPNLLPKPSSNAAQMAQLWNASLTWPERKAAAFEDPCPAMSGFRPGVGRVESIIADYVDFAKAAARRFGASAPAIGVHWNVVAWWEWLDVPCLDALNAAHPDAADFKSALLGLSAPCHRDTDHLVALATAMCGNGTCPEAVYMDVDYLYNTPYALDVLARNKAALRAVSPPLPFGVNIVDECGTAEACVVVDTGDALEAQTAPAPSDPNELHEQSLLAVFGFLARKGVIDAETRLRVASWSVRPHEVGELVDEQRPGSMAHAANRIFAEA